MSELVLDQPLRPLLELVDVRLDASAGGETAPDNALGLPLGPLSCGFDSASITGIIGIAGAGRAALRDLIAGVVAPSGGVIRMGGLRVDRQAPAARARLGMIAMHTGRLVPADTLEGMLTTARAMVTRPWWRLAFGVAHAPSTTDREDIAAILDFLGLSEQARRPVASLAGLEARLGELARCLVQRPRLLLLDQPFAGLERDHRRALAQILDRLRRANVTLVVIDDDLATLGRLADRCLVLHHGLLIADATPKAIGSTGHVFEALTGSGL
jgi:ABC-type branched-subunit amino acid transport system ATPase component